MTKEIEGQYHCQGCGKYFKASGGGAQTCTHCGVAQFSASLWDDVIRRRNNNIKFVASDTLKPAQAAKAPHDPNSLKLDIIGQKQAKRRVFVGLITLVWLAVISVIIYKVSHKTNDQVERVGDGSMTRKVYDEQMAAAQACKDTLIAFLATKDSLSCMNYILDPDIEKFDSFYGESGKPNTAGIERLAVLRVRGDQANLLFTTQDKKTLEAAFVKKGNKWLLDWKFFVNYSSMSFRDFITQQPLEEHEFRLLYTHKQYGLQQALNLYEFTRNKSIVDGLTSSKATINISENNPAFGDLKMVLKANDLYSKYNKTLNNMESGCFALKDPLGHFRIRVKLAYEIQNDYKQLVLKKVMAAHWLGDYNNSLLRPEQELLIKRKD